MSAGARVALAALLVLLALGALDIAVGKLLNSDVLRGVAEEAVREALSRDVTYDGLEHSWLPLSIRVINPRVSGPAPGVPPLAEAKSISLRIRVLPLFAGKLAIYRASLERPSFRVSITPKGVELMHLVEDEAPPEEVDEDAVAVALESVHLHGGTAVVEDHTREPAIVWELDQLEGEARRASPERPIGFEFQTQAAAGGSVAIRGQASPEAKTLDMTASLEGVDAARLASYLGESWFASGRMSGTLDVDTAPDEPLRVGAALALDGGELRFRGFALRGPFALSGRGDWGDDGFHGRIAVEADDAEFAWREAFVVEPGDAASASARLSFGGGSPPVLEDVHLNLRNAEVEGSATFGERTRVEARVPAFDLAGWETSIRKLAGYRLEGPLQGDVAIATNPPEVSGTARLDGVRVGLPDRGDLLVRAEIVGEGDTIEARGAEFQIGEQAVPVAVTVSNLDEAPFYHLRFRLQDVDANQWVSTFSRNRDTVYGKLSMDADLRGPVDPETPLLADVEGRVRADILEGRIVGVSLLQATFKQIGAASLGSKMSDLRRLFTGEHVEDLYTSDFESIGGTFDFGDGVVRTDDLRFVYSNFIAELAGEIGLLDLSLDMTGSLTLGEQIDQVLGNRLRLGSWMLGSNRTIPLAAVRGTLKEPSVEVADDWVANMALSVAKLPVQRAVDIVRGAAELPSRIDPDDTPEPEANP